MANLTLPKPRRSSLHKRLPKGKNGGIQLLLIHNVEHLGKLGEIVEVKRGYAMNYLLPQGLATIASDHHKRMVDKHREKLRQMEVERLQSLRDQASELEKQSITIEANATDDGHLYGSVSAIDIAHALKRAGLSIVADQIRLDGPLRELGLYNVKVYFHSEIQSMLKVWVVPTVNSDSAK